MEGKIINFRRGRRTIYNTQMVIEVKGYDKEKAKELIGKKLVWVSEGKNPKEIR